MRGLIVLGLLLAGRAADAGCPSSSSAGCFMPRDVVVTFAPDPECVTVRQEPNECTCRVTLWLANHCGEALVPEDFLWAAIDPPEAAGANGELVSEAEGRLSLEAGSGAVAGPGSTTFTATMGTESITITAAYELELLQNQGGCSASGAPATASGALLPLAGLGLLGLIFRRRRR